MSLSKLTSYATGVLILAYFTHTAHVFYQLFNPHQCEDEGVGCLVPYLRRNPRLKLDVYVSTLTNLKSSSSKKLERELKSVWQIKPFDVNNHTYRSMNISVPVSVVSNGSYYLHAVVLEEAVPSAHLSQALSTTSTSLTAHRVRRPDEYHLIQGKSNESEVVTDQERSDPITHWHPQITLCVMADNISIPTREIPGDVYPYLRVREVYGHNEYNPILYVDGFSSRSVDAVPISPGTTHLALTINYQPISYGKLRLRLHLTQAIGHMQGLGFGEKDTDEIKGLMADTNLYMLLLTFLISIFHLLFDFLAFKNDIQFWRNRKTMVGISSRTVLWRCISQIIIFLYLFDQEQVSLLILIPHGISTIIEMWKVCRALKLEVDWSKKILFVFPSLRCGSKSEQEGETEAFDSEAMKYLSYLLYPLCAGGAIYSLIYIPHKSWYSWCVSCLVNGIYAFGFLFMLPQLFLNYKLKSVAHLPWRAFMYKAFNTFIDDVFAFIITMPTAHRLACFRDDFVFIIYLYQKWLYPVDKSRPNEFGQTFEETKKKKKD